MLPCDCHGTRPSQKRFPLVSLTKRTGGFCGLHMSFFKITWITGKTSEKYPSTNLGKSYQGRAHPPSRITIFLFPAKTRVRTLIKIVQTAFVKIQYSKICLEYPAFLISFVPNYGKLYGRMRSIAQACITACSGTKKAGYQRNGLCINCSFNIACMGPDSFPE